MRQPQIRKKLDKYNTIDDAVTLLKTCKKILVLTGAGISTSVGIPDFRGKEGIYNTTKSEIFADTQDIFQLDNFKLYPREFYNIVQKIVPRLKYYQALDGHVHASSKSQAIPRFGNVHAFLNLLQSNGKLLATYTQNIDGLEKVAGVDGARIINCHGSWEGATCLSCGGVAEPDAYLQLVVDGRIPLCPCSKPTLDLSSNQRSNEQRQARPKKSSKPEDIAYLRADQISRSSRNVSHKTESKKRKRSSMDDNDDNDDVPPSISGLLKPDIIFFGEGITDYTHDLRQHLKTVDLLLIIGTSLTVRPVGDLPFELPGGIPQIWISNQSLKHKSLDVDIQLIGKCDLIIEELCARAGWGTKLKNRVWCNNFGSRIQAKSVVRKKSPALEPSDQDSVSKTAMLGHGVVAPPEAGSSTVKRPESLGPGTPPSLPIATAKIESQTLPSSPPHSSSRQPPQRAMPAIMVEDSISRTELPLRSPTNVQPGTDVNILSRSMLETDEFATAFRDSNTGPYASVPTSSLAVSPPLGPPSPAKTLSRSVSPTKSTLQRGLPGLRIEQDVLHESKWYIRDCTGVSKKAAS